MINAKFAGNEFPTGYPQRPISNDMAHLQVESEVYERELARMLEKHAGEYVIIHGSQAVRFLSTYETALDWAYEEFGLDEPFFVKKVVDSGESVAHFTRDLGPCRQ